MTKESLRSGGELADWQTQTCTMHMTFSFHSKQHLFGRLEPLDLHFGGTVIMTHFVAVTSVQLLYTFALEGVANKEKGTLPPLLCSHARFFLVFCHPHHNMVGI